KPAIIKIMAAATTIHRKRMLAATIARIIARTPRRSLLALAHAELGALEFGDADRHHGVVGSDAGRQKDVVGIHEVDDDVLADEGVGSRAYIDPRVPPGIVDHRRMRDRQARPDGSSV